MNEDENIEKILNNETIKKMFKIMQYEEIYELFGDVLIYPKTNYRDNKRLQNKLFIEYLKQLPKVNNNLYERILIKFLDKKDTSEIIEYLLNQKLNLNYQTFDKDNNRISLEYLLATKIKEQKNMQLLLEKIKGTRMIFFRSVHCKDYTDLCRMNIIAGNLEDALMIFYSDRYKLFDIDCSTDEKLKNILVLSKIITINGYDFYQVDLLYQIILTIKNADLDILAKRKFLIAILKSKKIKLFNTANLRLIEEILDKESYLQFLEYLKELEANEEVVLFSISSPDTICYKALDSIINSSKTKKIEE